MRSSTSTPPPTSTSSFIASLVAVVGFCVFYFSDFWPRALPAYQQAIVASLVFGVPLMLYDFFVLRVHYRESTGVMPAILRDTDWSRVGLKWLALACVFLVILFFYWVFPEYYWSLFASNNVYSNFISAASRGAPLLLVLAVPYFAWMDRRMVEPNDVYAKLGGWLLGHNPRPENERLRQLALGWLVKSFFLPLMFTYLAQDLENRNYQLQQFNGQPIDVWNVAYDFIYLLDVLVVTIGYCYTIRFADTYIRSTEPTASGWLVALVCYEPFWSLFSPQYFNYDTQTNWTDWLQDNPTSTMIWGGAILVCNLIYVAASIAFGLRFSNLTYRGLISGGPYRWTKHPAYFSKNLSWWLLSVPFIATETTETAIRSCLMLAGINMIYYPRAKTEERHLSRYPEYRDYMAWVNEHGIITKNLIRLQKPFTFLWDFRKDLFAKID
jgi:protein-S-isoprenylcysteine O-methyltransferase Ste14